MKMNKTSGKYFIRVGAGGGVVIGEKYITEIIINLKEPIETAGRVTFI